MTSRIDTPGVIEKHDRTSHSSSGRGRAGIRGAHHDCERADDHGNAHCEGQDPTLHALIVPYSEMPGAIGSIRGFTGPRSNGWGGRSPHQTWRLLPGRGRIFGVGGPTKSMAEWRIQTTLIGAAIPRAYRFGEVSLQVDLVHRARRQETTGRHVLWSTRLGLTAALGRQECDSEASTASLRSTRSSHVRNRSGGKRSGSRSSVSGIDGSSV